MNYENYHVYAVEGDEQISKCVALRESRKDAVARSKAYAESLGCEDTLRLRESVVAVIAAAGTKSPVGWKVDKANSLRFSPRPVFIPDRRVKAGKQASAAIAALKLRGGDDLANDLGFNTFTTDFINGQTYLVQSQAFEQAGQWFVLEPKQKDKPAPQVEGCRLLKLSEFFAMKEAAAVTA